MARPRAPRSYAGRTRSSSARTALSSCGKSWSRASGARTPKPSLPWSIASTNRLRCTRRGASADDPNHRLAALWIDAAIALDRRDLKAARAIYPTIVAQDERVSSVEDAEVRALDLVTKLEDTRAEFGLPRRCQ
jgi:hypothetical protein